MDGKDYRARVDLTDASGVVAAVGETCERVAAASLPWLLEQGLIGPIEPAADEQEREA